jgi:O-antigen/teichoic acid export membrane protein
MTHSTRHSVFLIGAYLATAVFNYVFGLLLSWYFTPAQFGVLGVAQSLLLLMALIVGSGFAWAAAHDVAANGVTDGTRRRFRSAWTANIVLGFLLGAGLWAAYVTGLLPLGPAYRSIIPLIGLTVALLAARSVVNGVARGLYRFAPVSANLVGEVVVKLVAGLILAAAGFGVTGIMLGFALGALASLFHSFLIVRQANLWRGPGWFDLRIIAPTFPLFASLLGTAFMLNLDVLGLKLFSPAARADELVGLYQAAVILARTPVYFAQALTLVLFSYVAGAASHQTRDGFDVSRYVMSAARSWFRFLAPIGVVLVCAPQTVLSLFFPQDYQAAAPALRIAAVGALLLALVSMLSGLLQAAGDRRRPALAASVAILVQIIALIWLVPAQGENGAAVSLVAAGCIALIILIPELFKFGRRFFYEGIGQHPRTNLSRLGLPFLMLLLPLFAVPDTNRMTALVQLGLAGLGYLCALLVAQWRSVDFGRPPRHVLAQFVQVMIGG